MSERPTVIGAFRAERRLVRDRTGEYWLARDRDLDRYCLLRLHTPSVSERAPPIDRQQLSFALEARALAAVDHPNVARLLDHGLDLSGRPFIVLPAYPKRLTERLDQTPSLDVAHGTRIMLDISAALAAVHAAGFAHGALGPEHVFLRERPPYAKLLGFSEMAGGAAAAADVFQLGLLAFRVLAGAAPSAGVLPSDLAPDIAPALERWIVRCLSREPEARPQSGAAALQDLREALAA